MNKPSFPQGIGRLSPLITTNCAVLAVTVLRAGPDGICVLRRSYGYLSALVNAIGPE